MASKTVAAARALPATYFALVKAFPLTHIDDDAQLEEAMAVIDRLLREDLDRGGEAYLDALSDLVETYEAEQFAIADASEADVLRELMSLNGLSQPKLAEQAGIAQSTISAVLNGGRSLTKNQVIVLARFFRVPAAVFLPA